MATTTVRDVRLVESLPPATGRAGLRGALASEFTKIRSVRSTYWTLGALFIVSVGLAVAITAGTAANFANNPGNKAGFDATQASLEEAFMELTADSVEYHAHTPGQPADAADRVQTTGVA